MRKNLLHSSIVLLLSGLSLPALLQPAQADPLRQLARPAKPGLVARYGGGSQEPLPPAIASAGQLGFSAQTYSVAENAGSVSLAVVRSGGDNGAVSVSYAVAGGTATAGEDYTPVSGVLTWNNKETGPKSFSIPVIDDARQENDKTVTVTLGNATGGAVLAQSQATLTIVNDDTRSAADQLTSVAQNPTQLAMAEAIAEVYDRGQASPALQALLQQLIDNAGSDPAGVANALQQIAPEEFHAQHRLLIEGGATQQRNLESRLYALRRGTRCIDVSGLNAKINQEIINAHAFATPPDKCPGGANTAGEDRWGVFANGDLTMGKRDVTSREAGFDFDTKGVTVGADYRLSGRAVVGGALGYLRSGADFAGNGGKLEVDGYSLSLYGTFYETDKFYLDAIYSYNDDSFDSQRAVRYRLSGLEVNQLAMSSNGGTQHSLSLGMGHHFHHGNFTSSPNVHLDYSRLELDGTREQMSDPAGRGAALALAVDNQETESVRMRLGWNFSYTLRQSWGVLVPQLSLHAIADLGNDYKYLTGHFVEDASGVQFAIRSDRPDRGYGEIGLGLLAEFAPGKMAYFQYQKLVGMKDFEREAFTLGVRFEF